MAENIKNGKFEQTEKDKRDAEEMFARLSSGRLNRVFGAEPHVKPTIDMHEPLLREDLRSMTPDGAKRKAEIEQKVRENLKRAERSASVQGRPEPFGQWSGGRSSQPRSSSPKISTKLSVPDKGFESSWERLPGPEDLFGSSKSKGAIPKKSDSRPLGAFSQKPHLGLQDKEEDEENEAIDHQLIKKLVEEFSSALNLKNVPQKQAVESAIIASFQARAHGWYENVGPLMAAELGQFTSNVIQSVLGSIGAIGLTEFKAQTEVVGQIKRMCETLLAHANKSSMNADEYHKQTINAIQSTLTEDLMRRNEDSTREINRLRNQLSVAEARCQGVNDLLLAVFNNVPYIASASTMTTMGKRAIGDAIECGAIDVPTACEFLMVPIGQKYEKVREIVAELDATYPGRY